jgi:hypothetical protein
LRWLLLAHPERIAAAPGVLEALAPLVSDDGWSRFTERNGFDPRRSPTLLAAGFELGTLYLIEPPEPAHGRSMEERFRERLSHGEVVARPHPALTRVQGVLAGTPQALLRVEDRFVAHADGDPSLIRIVEGFLLGRFTKTPSALRGATLRAHATFADGAPLRAWIPGPLDDLSVFPDSEVFHTATAALVALELFEPPPCAPPCSPDARRPEHDGPALRIQLALAGPWSSDADADAASLEQLWHVVARSALGRLLRLDGPLSPPRTQVVPTEDGVRLELVLELPLAPLVHGLHEVVAGELSDVFAGGPAADPAHVSPLAAFRRPTEAVD